MTDNVASGGFITGCIIARNNGMKSGILSGIGFGAFGAAIDELVSLAVDNLLWLVLTSFASIDSG